METPKITPGITSSLLGFLWGILATAASSIVILYAVSFIEGATHLQFGACGVPYTLGNVLSLIVGPLAITVLNIAVAVFAANYFMPRGVAKKAVLTTEIVIFILFGLLLAWAYGLARNFC